MRETRITRPGTQLAHLLRIDRATLGDPPLDGVELLLDEAPRPRLPLSSLGVEPGDDRHPPTSDVHVG